MRDNHTILHRLQLWSADQPHLPAQYYKDSEQKWKPISVKAYWLQVVRIALYLERKLLTELSIEQKLEQKRIVIFAANSPEWAQWELGIWLVGMISVGIHPNTQKKDYEKMLMLASPSLVVTDTLAHSIMTETQAETLTFVDAAKGLMEKVPEDERTLLLEGVRLLSKVELEKVCTSIFTSGTMGTPKGVLLGLKQLTFVADSLSREWNLPFSNGTLFSFLPLAHVAEKVHSVAVAITMRYPVWFNSSFDRFLPELQEVRPTMLLAVPRVWQRIKEQVEAQKPKLMNYLTDVRFVGTLVDQIYLHQVRSHLGLDRLKLAVSGAAKLPPMVFDWFLRLGVEIQEIYGMSETAGLISLTHSPRETKTAHLVGSVPAGLHVEIREGGEVWVKGPQVFFGYDQNPEENENSFLDGWFKTGDLGEWVKDAKGERELHLIGRTREIIKLQNGRMVAPVPIENELKKIEKISNVCLMGDQLPGLVALITLKEKNLMDYKFKPGMVEGVLIEDDVLKAEIRKAIDQLWAEEKISERIHQIFILSRDFELEHGEITPTHKLARYRIAKNFSHFVDLKLQE